MSAWRTCRRLGGEIKCKIRTENVNRVDKTDPMKVGIATAKSTFAEAMSQQNQPDDGSCQRCVILGNDTEPESRVRRGEFQS